MPETGRVFKGTLTFTDFKFTSNLADKESQEYQNLKKAIQQTFTSVYNEIIPGFLKIEVVEFIEGETLGAEVLVTTRFESSATAEDLETLTLKANDVNKFGDYKLSSAKFVDVTDTQEPKRRRFNTVVKIVNIVFTSALNDKTSETFKNLSKSVEASLSAVYRNKIPGFLYLKIISFEKGSVICNFIVYTTPESNATESSLKNALVVANNENDIGGFKISEEIVVKEVKSTKPTTSDKMELWIILLIAVGSPVLMVLIIVLIVYVSIKINRIKTLG